MDSEDETLFSPPENDASTPIPQSKLRRLKRLSRVSEAPSLPNSDPLLAEPDLLPEAQEHSDQGESTDTIRPLFGSEGSDDGMPSNLGGDGLEDPGREEVFINGSGGSRSARKRLSLGGAEEPLKKKKKDRRDEERKTKASAPNKRQLEKERKQYLVQIHADSQRLLRETRDVSFSARPVVQKPISSVLQKIRQRKLEVMKSVSTFDGSNSLDYDADDDTMMDTSHRNVIGSVVENNMVEGDLRVEGDRGLKLDDSNIENSDDSEDFLPSREAVLNNKPLVDKPSEAQARDLEDISCESQVNTAEDGPIEDHTDIFQKDSPSFPARDLNLTSSDDDSSDEEYDDKENVDPCSRKSVNKDPYLTDHFVKDFLDEEAEEEDDSDHDLSRFQENEENEESEGSEGLNDLIATGYKEMPVDHEKRNELHQKWLEQQDAAATDDVLQRLKCGHKQRDTTLLSDEEDDEEFGKDSIEVITEVVHSMDAVRKNSKKAKQMISQMFTDKEDAFVSSDDEETEQMLYRQRLLEHNGDSNSLISPLEDESSREVFGLIKKLNIAPDTKKRPKPTASTLDMLLSGRNRNTSSKSSFLGRMSSNSVPSSHKQGSGLVKSFIFGRDDSNSRSSMSTSETLVDKEHKENHQARNRSAKYSNSQSTPTGQESKPGSDVTQDSSLFQILQRKSMHFDQSFKNKDKSVCQSVSETQTTYQFAALRSGNVSRLQSKKLVK
ncbi:hypothetical protein QJS10_CPB19g00494 [Acorus calamus]|uniref:Uncharacterized protein n=1 Tax=Acorus calamus TaxID=4465 RepID=A0AAV9CIY5_ACOCL|nr:hypothetical protein QJS10_CPB19g00494 [Acorus calamus]